MSKKDGWKIDWDLHIIYLYHEMDNAQILSLVQALTTDPRGLSRGAGEKWSMVVVENQN